ncbi:heme exporter protein CcmD [Candidatus Pelagibacter sp. HIMB1483]|jgi:heme exporter protein D|uniref:heme exporter protein CcmD n=1 Tax=Candidatus Pelagibacter sp. HIMB1483 TaxID=3415414 RepID=UPI003F82D40F|tara:strand:- start:140 stop:367 length:228 start_codon:yes stop_codon:yes gene_type:complete
MINELLTMNGYGLYVWSSFLFTFLSFLSLYLVVKTQYVKEKNKFIAKFGNLNSERAASARNQSINKEILSNSSNI